MNVSCPDKISKTNNILLRNSEKCSVVLELPEEDWEKDVSREWRADDVADVDGDELGAVHVDLPRQAHQTYGRHETENGSNELSLNWLDSIVFFL